MLAKRGTTIKNNDVGGLLLQKKGNERDIDNITEPGFYELNTGPSSVKQLIVLNSRTGVGPGYPIQIRINQWAFEYRAGTANGQYSDWIKLATM